MTKQKQLNRWRRIAGLAADYNAEAQEERTIREQQQQSLSNLNTLRDTRGDMYYLVHDPTDVSEPGDVISHVNGEAFANIFIGAGGIERATRENWALYPEREKANALADVNARLEQAGKDFRITETLEIEHIQVNENDRPDVDPRIENAIRSVIRYIKNNAQHYKDDPDLSSITAKDYHDYTRILQLLKMGNEAAAKSVYHDMDTAARELPAKADIVPKVSDRKTTARFFDYTLNEAEEDDDGFYIYDIKNNKKLTRHASAQAAYEIRSEYKNITNYTVVDANGKEVNRHGKHINSGLMNESEGRYHLYDKRSKQIVDSGYNRTKDAYDAKRDFEKEDQKHLVVRDTQKRYVDMQGDPHSVTEGIEKGSMVKHKKSGYVGKVVNVSGDGESIDVKWNKTERVAPAETNEVEIVQEANNVYDKKVFTSHEDSDVEPSNVVKQKKKKGIEGKEDTPSAVWKDTAEEDKDESPTQLRALDEPSDQDNSGGGDLDRKVKVPNNIKQELKGEIDQARKEAKKLNTYNKAASDFYNNLAGAFEDLLNHIEGGTVYDLKQAQMYAQSLMGPMLHKIPANVMKFLAYGGQPRSLKSYMTDVSKNFPITGPRNELK